MYIEMTREEVLSLQVGDICYIMSSYGMQRCVYPNLDETHRNLFWSKQLTELGYDPTTYEKTIEMLRDWGPIYKIDSPEKEPKETDPKIALKFLFIK